MPAIMGDPASATIYRATGASPYPTPTNTALPTTIKPLHITLRDGTPATILPVSSLAQIPRSLSDFLCAQMNAEIEEGDTYPMLDPFPEEAFAGYWFANFVAVMMRGHLLHLGGVEELGWEGRVLGTFYVKPNYTGRSSHVCNAGFLVTKAARGMGVGGRLGEAYLQWAPELGYIYSVFNLVYETNVASCKIWDGLGFERIGRVKMCGKLKSYDHLVDAIIYGKDLRPIGAES